MLSPVFLPVGHTDALDHAVNILIRKGCDVARQPDNTVTHLLLPVPSFEPGGLVKGGDHLEEILARLPKDVIIFGGNLDRISGYRTADFLKDPLYLAENANITAHCALGLAIKQLPVTLQDCQTLVIGWGRIGKCLAALLKQIGAKVTVATRKEADRAMLRALGYDAEDTAALGGSLTRFRVIFNTAPVMVLDADKLRFCRPGCLKIDLASASGIAGDDVLWARGLPGRDAPEASGVLIARTAIAMAARKEYQK